MRSIDGGRANSSQAMALAQRRRDRDRSEARIQAQIAELRTLLIAALERIEQLEGSGPPDLAA